MIVAWGHSSRQLSAVPHPQTKTKTKKTIKNRCPKSSYNTRNASSYQFPVHRLTATERRSTYAGAKLWNALPKDLKKTNKLQFGRRDV
ncbi:hypothetical protein J6590_042450 [Homalodisca vitripennis]|nr:hypothetical protein J6590_042450 [Homalodisca vitripennis]